jgi:hypothetical protein
MTIDLGVFHELSVEVYRSKGKEAKKALATVAYRLHTGLPPFPSQVKEWVKDMEYQGEFIDKQRAKRILEKIEGGGKSEVKDPAND